MAVFQNPYTGSLNYLIGLEWEDDILRFARVDFTRGWVSSEVSDSSELEVDG